MRCLRSIAITLLLAAVALTGCARSQPDQDGVPDSRPPVATAPPSAPAPAPAPAPADDRPDSPPAATATAAPRILWVRTTPALRSDGFWRHLPAGAGTVVFRVRAVHTTKVGFDLAPTGTGVRSRPLGQDTNGRNGWTLTWRYKDEPLLAHLTVSATGPGGTASRTIGLHHPEPAPRILSVRTTPALRSDGFWRYLPAGAGTVVFRVQTANNVQRVRFYLTPTGTGMFDESQLVGQDSNGRDGWSLTWHYRADQFTPVHLTVNAIGSGGTASEIIGIDRPDPAS